MRLMLVWHWLKSIWVSLRCTGKPPMGGHEMPSACYVLYGLRKQTWTKSKLWRLVNESMLMCPQVKCHLKTQKHPTPLQPCPGVNLRPLRCTDCPLGWVMPQIVQLIWISVILVHVVNLWFRVICRRAEYMLWQTLEFVCQRRRVQM